MSGAKETPRQKMIGMMYLVYTALLAMNVSKDILDAFDTVNTGVQQTNITLTTQIKQKYDAFEEQYGIDKEKVGPYWEQAQDLRGKTTEIINYIEAMKWDLVKQIEEKDYASAIENGLLKTRDTITYNGRLIYNINTSKIKSRDNYNKPTEYMMGNPEGNGRAFELSEKIRQYRYEIVKVMGMDHIHELGLVTDSIYGTKDFVMEQAGVSENNLKKLLPNEEYYGARIDYAPEAEDALSKGWEYRNFHHTVLIADVTLLNKIISEIETAELNAVTQLAHDIHGSDYTFDNVGAKVFAESSYLISGQTYNAQAMVTAWKNSQTTARVSLDGGAMKDYTSDATGLINLNFQSGVGEHHYEGTIEMRNPSTNAIENYPFAGSYTVAPPSVTISPTKMNVVYAGIDNPISVGAAGFSNSKLNVTATNATLTRIGDGLYNLRPTASSGEVKVSASAEGASLGSFTLRIKELPKPMAKIDNVVEGKVTKSALLAANCVRAEMKDFDFEGVKYDVVGYTVVYKTKAGTVKEEKVTGSKFNDNLKTVFNSANPGDLFMFRAIRVKGNDNKEKVLDSQIGVEIK